MSVYPSDRWMNVIFHIFKSLVKSFLFLRDSAFGIALAQQQRPKMGQEKRQKKRWEERIERCCFTVRKWHMIHFKYSNLTY